MMEIIRMVVVLSAITGLSGFVLSGLKVWTTPIIEEQVLMNVQGPALKQLFVNSNNDPIADRKKLPKPGSEGEEIVVFPAIKDGKLLAVAMEAKGKEPAKAALKKDGGDVDAISGATLSSVGSADAVKQAAGWYVELKDTIKTTWQ
jgi:electron transport complex protein RnfG